MNGGGHSERFVPHRIVKSLLGISDTTVRRWAQEGRLEYFVTDSGHRRYDISKFISSKSETNGQKVCYCRVSTKKQAPDLANQIKFCQEQYPDYGVIQDIGSALNWKRKGLITLLDRVFQGDIREIVVTHRDRLCRFGFELLFYIFEKHQVKLVVLDQNTDSGPKELADDILSIITVFSARYYGHRKYSHESHQSQDLSIT